MGWRSIIMDSFWLRGCLLSAKQWLRYNACNMLLTVLLSSYGCSSLSQFCLERSICLMWIGLLHLRFQSVHYFSYKVLTAVLVPILSWEWHWTRRWSLCTEISWTCWKLKSRDNILKMIEGKTVRFIYNLSLAVFVFGFISCWVVN